MNIEQNIRFSVIWKDIISRQSLMLVFSEINGVTITELNEWFKDKCKISVESNDVSTSKEVAMGRYDMLPTSYDIIGWNKWWCYEQIK